ncbi:MAG: bifunctional phosphopantothenoylcysteine decarboxylase/phosphopantothenate--cysteine ligase CoaBC [Lachnospiraceae bacterium]|nr:bifunctional phosphopantothenoylcysteine decarboxylase/phosphopantothenate--cysteine ligase CoaBC [Lachnospiraceae bacterium]
MLTGKKVVLGVSGSIAAYKMANVASMLKKLHCDVHVILTENASQFITPITFETLTKNPCLMDDFARTNPVDIHHITLGQTADLLMIAPASANVIGKMANGIADDLLTSTIIAATCPVLVAPAMNAYMYQNPIVQDNICRLKGFGYAFIEPAVGHLACDVDGIGKLPEESVLVDAIIKKLTKKRTQDFADRHILVTAGPTRESLDPVRFITNHSTGKMGYAIAEQAAKRGAKVTLVTGPVKIEVPKGVTAVSITTAKEMYQEVIERAKTQDMIIKAAAVADYRPKQVNTEKTKKKDGDLVIELERTKDILAELGSRKSEKQCICGFSMETENVLENSRKKLVKKNVDMIAANSIRESGAGFGVDTNHLVLITKDGEDDLGMLSKEDCADALLDRVLKIWKNKQK